MKIVKTLTIAFIGAIGTLSVKHVGANQLELKRRLVQS